MRLNTQTDYALRILMRLALEPDAIVTIETIANEYQISRNHLMKVAHQLGKLNYIETVRGRAGGLRLAINPSDCLLGDIIHKIEPDFALVECFNAETSTCVIRPACRLKSMLHGAMQAFLTTMNQHTLQDLMAEPDALRELLEFAS